MSIAVSAVIVPSRLLRCAVASCAAVHLGAGTLLLAFGPAAVAGAPLLALACLAVAASAACHCHRYGRRKWRRIDISGLGAVRLTVQGYRAPPGAPLALLAGATLWPGLLLLRLQAGSGKTQHLLLLPDSVAPGIFRPLAAALRDIAVRNKKFLKINEKC
jgi:toxin CptA